MNFLELFRQANDRQVVQAEALEFATGGTELALATNTEQGASMVTFCTGPASKTP
ncbi:MAG: hypothetical protein HC933_16705 [Pleurocapsa sp. SU_196_0]|nr:hypothetical protein [Pleurocapsa sp. SU_196_0]